MFLCFFYVFVLFNVMFLLFFCTKLQIWCISHGERLHFRDRASVLAVLLTLFDSYWRCFLFEWCIQGRIQDFWVGGGMCAPSPENFLIFLCGNNAFWCTFDVGLYPTSEKNSELLSHRSGAFWSAAGHSDFICGMQEQRCCMLALIKLTFQRLYCWHTYDCPFVAVSCNFVYCYIVHCPPQKTRH